MNLYCVYDRVAEEASSPIPAKTDGVAIRMFVASMQKNEYPEDYWLYRIGHFDPISMYLDPQKPERLIIGKQEVES